MNTVICIRVEDADPDLVISGSRKIRCSGCQALIWISPASEKAAGGGYRAICTSCTQEDSRGVVTMAQIEEFDSWVRKRLS